MSDWVTFEGAVEPLHWGRATYTILRVPDEAVVALGGWVAKSHMGEAGHAKAPVPWFAFGFLALVVIGSTGLVPKFVVDASRFVVPIMLAASVAALGLQTDLRALHARGAAPLLLGVAATLFITCLALVGVAVI